MLLQLERQFLQANLVQVNHLLEDCSADDDPIGHFQYVQLVEELEQKLAAMPGLIERAPASLALFFGGLPVIGSQGIQAGFSGKAIEKFQTIVSQRFAAQEIGPLAARGRLPKKDNTHLMVTDVVRGSFGFVLQAAQPEISEHQLDTSLKAIVDQVADTISRVAAQDEGLFDDAVAQIDDRQKGALSEFFKLLDNEGATLRLVEGERDFELDHASIQRARQRVEHMQIEDRNEQFVGEIIGWTDLSAKFEMKRHDNQQIVQGNIDRQALERISLEEIEPYHKHFRAQVKVREIIVRNKQPKIAYTLQGLESVEAPTNWPIRTRQGVLDA